MQSVYEFLFLQSLERVFRLRAFSLKGQSVGKGVQIKRLSGISEVSKYGSSKNKQIIITLVMLNLQSKSLRTKFYVKI